MAVPELCRLHPSIPFRMLENDSKRPYQTRSLPNKELEKNKKSIWPNTVSNKELLEQCHEESMETILMRRRSRWVGHVLRREPDNIACGALHWTPEGKRKRRRLKNI